MFSVRELKFPALKDAPLPSNPGPALLVAAHSAVSIMPQKVRDGFGELVEGFPRWEGDLFVRFEESFPPGLRSVIGFRFLVRASVACPWRQCG